MIGNSQTNNKLPGARRAILLVAAFLFASIASNLHAGTIVGAWYFTGGGMAQSTGVATFLSDGRFMFIEDGDPLLDPSGEDGLEKGTYNWNPATGAFSINTLINTNGRWGFCNAPTGASSPFCGPPAGTTLTATDTILTLTVPGEGQFSTDKLYDPNSPIVGAWYFSNGPAATDLTVVAFLPGGKLMVGIDPPTAGFIEFGAYAWNPATGALTVTIDTSNAPPGSSANLASFTSASFANGGLVLSSPTTTLSLINSEVPEPATIGLFGAALAVLVVRRCRFRG